MLLKNENEINNNICQSVLEYAKDNKKKILYFLNDKEIFFEGNWVLLNRRTRKETVPLRAGNNMSMHLVLFLQQSR